MSVEQSACSQLRDDVLIYNFSHFLCQQKTSIMMGNSQSFLHGFFFSRKVSWILTIYFLLHHPPKFEDLNFSAGSLASHKTGFQTMLTERSQPPVSSFSTKVVNFTSQGRSSLEKICFAGEAHCSAAKGSALWSVGVRGGPGTQEPPGYSRSDLAMEAWPQR